MSEKLLQEIRDNFQYSVDAWRSIREEGRLDMRYVAGDPWDPKERKARTEAGRPCLALDELNQYVNQLINDVRQNKRAIRVVPKGGGADEKTAELRANIIRQIEYKSNAQAAYSCAFENAAQRSYGYFRVSKRYVDDQSFDQELAIGRIPNPDTVYIDPDCKEADCSDMRFAYVLDRFRMSEFRRRWPGAEVKDFSAELIEQAPQWIGEDWVQVAEYWRVESRPRVLLLVDDGSSTGLRVYEDELPAGHGLPVVNQRRTQERKVVQYITNGVEILETNTWDGRWIPIVPVFGKELYVDDGSGSKRVLMSLVRLARDPYMLYCYYRTCEAELVGMAPKAPYVGYEGQFENHEEEWSQVNKVPIPYLQVKPQLDATGQAVLPLPRRESFEPPIQALELGADSAKRAIQSALGMYNASVGKQDSNARSGVAIKALDSQSNQGSYHFIDNYDRALEHAGRILNDLLDVTYDTPREIGIRKPNDEYAVAQIAGLTEQGEHDVTISTGPSFQSQRDAVEKFADTLAQSELFPRIADLVVKLRNLGPIGDEIAKRLTPPEFAAQDGQEALPPQAVQALQQAQQQLQAINAYAQQLEAKASELQQTLDAKQMEIASRERIAALQAQTQLVLAHEKLTSAENIEVLRQQVAELQTAIEVMLAERQPAPTESAVPSA